MDYEFEAPQYVNFASAMDEDDHDVSKYFDVEHEHNFRESRVKVDPQDILPKGVRTFASTSKPNRGGSLKSTQSSEPAVGHPPKTAGINSLETAVLSPPQRITRSSLKGTPVHTTPSVQYADCLTPGVKRLRTSTDNTPEGTPSKRLKSTPCVVIKALANIQLSPATVTVDTLLQDAVETLDRIRKSAKKPNTPSVRRLSVVDGINVELKQEKDHKMETRADKQQRQPPLHLRSRSVPRSQLNRSQVSSPSKTKPELKSRVRPRSVSKDRGVPTAKSNKEADRFVSLSDVLNKLHTKSTTQFKLKKNSPSKLTNGPLKPLRPTAPVSTDVETRFRNRTTSVETRNVKLNGTPGNLFKPLNFEKKTPTVPEPFKLTEVRKKEVSPGPQPFKFTARPVPKSVLEPSNKGVITDKTVPPNKGKTSKKGQTPQKKIIQVLEESNGRRVLVEKDISYLNGMKFTPKRELTETKPFSFEVRENERLARKNARLQEKLEAEIRGQPQFHANPLPVFPTPRNLRRSPSPFSRKPAQPTANGPTNGVAKRAAVPAVKAPLAPNFRARAPVVLAKKPFEPVKPQRQLPLPAVTLNSEVRAKERQEFEKKQAEKEAQIQAIAKRMREEREKREQEATARLRREIVHKAKPIPDLKAFEPQPSDKPLTDPKTPFFMKRSVATTR